KAGLRIRIPLDDPRNPISERFAQILGVLERYPHHRIKVEVHCQSGAKPEMNLEFSEMAARAVRDFFVERGVAPERITHQGLGDTLPLFPAKSPLAAKNQRIEIFLTR
ncbi:MAG: OmpA family protein, partial [Leptospiraceae bacterium]|nr:OmpA family protein [Leptospiraceae bacterium]